MTGWEMFGPPPETAFGVAQAITAIELEGAGK